MIIILFSFEVDLPWYPDYADFACAYLPDEYCAVVYSAMRYFVIVAKRFLFVLS